MNQSWSDWIDSNKEKFDIEFEIDFVRNVLSKIELISFNDIILQYSFIDSKGKNRRVDFVIKNDIKGYFLAIELDGARRDSGETQELWADFLERQNDLLDKVGPLLRFSNSQLYKNPSNIIRRIKSTLKKQQDNFIAEKKLKDLQIKQIKELSRIRLLIADNEKNNSKYITLDNKKRKQYDSKSSLEDQLNKAGEDLELTQKEFSKLKSQQLKEALSVSEQKFLKASEESKKMLRAVYAMTGIVLVSMIFIIYTQNEKIVDDSYSKNQNTMIQNSSINQIINASEAIKNINQQATFCGIVFEIRKFNKGYYLNLNDKYPNHALTITIWEEKKELLNNKFGSINNLLRKKICVYGKVKEYKGKAQIELESADHLNF